MQLPRNQKVLLLFAAMLCLAGNAVLGQGLITTEPASPQDTAFICLDDRDSIRFTASYPQPYDSIIWNFQGSSPSRVTGPGPHTVTYSSVGNFKATARLYSGDTLTATQVVRADVRQIGLVSFALPDTVCESDPPITLSASPSGGDFSGTGVVGNKFEPDQANHGQYTITYTVVDGSCTTNVSQSVYVLDAPEMNFRANGLAVEWQGMTTYYVCDSTTSGKTFKFYNPAFSVYDSYTIDFGDGSAPASGVVFPNNVGAAITHNYPPGLYTVTLTLFNNNGCSRSESIAVFLGNQPAVGFNYPGAEVRACIPRDSNYIEMCFPVSGVSGNSPFTIYTFSTNDGSPPITYSHPPPDTICHRFYQGSCGFSSSNFNNSFEVSLKAELPCDKAVAIIGPISISDPSKGGFILPQNACVDQQVTITDTATIGGVVQNETCHDVGGVLWSISPNTYTVTGGAPSLGSTFGEPDPIDWVVGDSVLNVTFHEKGVYTITQIAGNSLECGNDTVVKTICIDTLPTGSMVLNKNVLCVGDSVSGAFVGDVFEGCNGLDINWSITSGPHAHFGRGTPLDTNQNFVFNQVGIWPISATVSNGCGSIFLEDSVTVQGPPQVSLPPDSTICGLAIFDFSDPSLQPTVIENLASVSYQWSVAPAVGWSFAGGTGNSSSNPVIDFEDYGTYQVYVQVTNSCGVRTDTMSITLNEPPAIDPISDTIVCVGEDVFYKAHVTKGTHPFTYQWYVNGTPHNSTDSIQLVNLQVDQSISLLVEDDKNCTDSISFRAKVMPVPVVNAGADQQICYSDSIQLGASVSGGTNPFSYSWSPSAGLSDPNTLEPWRSPLDSMVTYVLSVTDSLGCTYTDTVEIDVFPIPFYDAGADFTLCLNSGDTTLNAAVPAHGTWTGTGLSGDTFSPVMAGVGVHPLVYEITDSNGCHHFDTVQVTVISQPEVDFGMSQTEGCSPLTISFSDSTAVGGTYAWYKNGIAFSTAANPTDTFLNTSSTQDSLLEITLVFQASSGCGDSITKSITIFPKPAAAFDLPSAICAGDSITPLNNSQVKGGAVSYRWSASTKSITFSDTTVEEPVIYAPDFQNVGDSLFSIQLIVVSPDGCSDTLSRNIMIHSRPVASFGLPEAVCGSFALAPTDSSMGDNLSYQWSVSPQTGVSVTGASMASPQFDIDSPSQDPQVYHISLSVTDTNGCTDQITKDYTVYPLPTAAFSASPTDSCGPLSLSFTNASDPRIDGEGLGDMNFKWDFGNGQTSQAQDTVITFTNTGVEDSLYPVRLVASNSFGCADTVYDTITVHPDPRADLILGNTVSCAPFYIDSTTVGAVRYDQAIASYTWKLYDADTVLLRQFPGIGGLKDTLWQDGDSLYVRLVVTSPFGCETDSSDLQLLYTIENPVPDFAAIPDSICSGGIVGLRDSSSAGVNHEWFVNDSLFSVAKNPDLPLFNNSHSKDSVVTIKLRIKAGNGCADSISKDVVVHPRPLAQFGTTPVCAGDSLQVYDSSLGDSSLSYHWSSAHTGVVFSDTAVAEPVLFFPDNQSGTDKTYQIRLIVANAEGCSDTAIENIMVYSRPVASFTLPAAACGPLTLLPSDSSTSSVSYQWDITPQTGVSVSGANTSAPQFDIDAPAQDSLVYRIKLSLTDSNGCIDTLTQEYTVYPLPTADFTTSQTDSCSPSLVHFTNMSDPHITGDTTSDMSFEWDFGNGQTSRAQDTTISFTNTGVEDSVYPMRLVAFNSFGCADTLYDSIRVHPDPRAELVVDNTVSCAPFDIDSGIVRAVTYAHANDVYTWKIYNTDTVFLRGHDGAYGLRDSILEDGDSIYVRLVVTSPFGCDADSSDLQLLYTIENPVPDFVVVSDSICSGGTVVFQDSSSPGVNHEWLINGTVFSAVQNPSLPLFNDSHIRDSIVTIKLRITAGSGCADSISKDVVVHPRPLAQFGTVPVCAGDSLQVNDSSLGDSSLSYHWSSADTGVVFTDTAVAEPVLFFPDNQSGTDKIYQIQLVVTNAEGCSDTAMEDVTVYSRPVASFTLPAAACGPLTLLPSDSSTGSGLSYQWDITPRTGVSVSGETTSAPQFDLDAPAQDSLVYRIKLSLTNDNGCTDSLEREYTVYPLPTADFTTLQTDSCSPSTVQFTNMSDPHITGDTTSDMSFEWDFGNGQTSKAQDTTISFTNTGVEDSVYPVRLVAFNSFGCADTLYDSIRVHPDPRAELVVSNTVSCAPFDIDSGIVRAVTYAHANDVYTWKIYNTDTVFLRDHEGAYGLRDSILDDGDSIYLRLVVTSPFGCETDSSDLQLLYTIENPVPDFAAIPDSLCSGGTVGLQDSSSAGVDHEWFVNDSLFSIAQNPDLPLFNNSHTKDSVVTIKLRITAGSGCSDSISKNVVVHPRPLAQFNLATACAGDSVQATNTSLSDTIHSYRWSSTDTAVVFTDTTAADPIVYFPDNQSGTDKTYQIRLIVGNAEGCSDTAIENITVHSRPVAAFTLPASACGPLALNPTAQSSGTGSSYQWDINPLTGVTVSGETTATPQFDIAAPSQDSLVYRIRLSLTDANGCIDTLTQEYVVYPLPTAGFIASQTDRCGPLTVSFTNTSDPHITGDTTSDMSFEWDFGNGQTSKAQDTTMSFTNTGVVDSVYPVRLVAFNSFGCADTLYDTIIVHPDPRAELVVGNTVSCAPFPIDSTVVGAVRYNLANDIYTWKVYDADTVLIGSHIGSGSIDETIITDGDSIYVRLVVTSLHSCTKDSTALQLFRTIENPKPAFAAVPDSLCSGGLLNLHDSSSVGVSHEWFVNDSLFSTNQNPSLQLFNRSYMKDSTVFIKLRITAGNSGCVDSIVKGIVVHPRPLADFSLAAEACADDSIQATDLSVAGGALLYHWSTTDPAVGISDTAVANPVLHFPDNQSGTDIIYQVQLIVTNTDGCSDTAVKDITVHSRPVASFTLPAAACGPLAVNPTDQSSGSALSYQWDIHPLTNVTLSGETTSAPQFDIAAPLQDSLVYRILLTVTDSNGCVDTLGGDYTVYPLPTAGFTASVNDSCGPLRVDFTNASAPHITGETMTEMSFDWDFGNGQSSQAQDPQITFTNTGVVDSVYPVRLVAYNSFGCADTLYDSITVRPDPRAELDTGKTLACAPFAIDQSNISAVAYPNANQTYEWEVVDVSSGNILNTFSGANSVNFVMTEPGDSMLVRLITTSPNGCANDTAEQLFITIPNPEPGFVLSDTAGCHPLNISITDTSSPGLSYEWYVNGDLQASTAANPNFMLTNTSTATDSVYTIKLVVTASTGCKDSISQDVLVHALPVPLFSYAEVCDGDSLFFQNQSTSMDSIVQWDWDFGDGNSSNDESPAHLYSGHGEYVVVLAATDSRGCVQSFSDTVTVRPNPQADFTSGMFCAPDTACLNKVFSFSDISSVPSLGGSIVAHEWDMMNDGVVEYTSANPTHVFNQAGVFDVKLAVETEFACKDSIVRQVVVLDTLQAFFTTDTTASCGPLDISASDSSQGLIGNYQWELVSLNRFGAETSIFTSVQQSPSSIPTLVPGYERDTVYILRLTVSNCCDTSSFERTFRLRPLPVAGMSVLPTSGCSGFKSTFVLDGHTFGKPDSVILDFGDGSQRTLQPNKVIYFGDTLYLFGAQSHHYINNGNQDTVFIASLTAINDCGDSTVSIPITVHPNIVQASFAYTPHQGCEDLRVDFIDASYGGTSVGWYFDFDSINNTPQQFADTGFVVSHTYTDPGTYLVAQVVNDGCSFDTAFASVTVFDAPDPEFVHTNNICEGDTFHFTNQTQVSTGSITFYRWAFGDGDSSNQKDPIHVYDSAGVYDVWLLAGSSNGCVDSVMHQVNVFDKPQVEFGYQHACLNEQPIFFSDSTTVQSGSIVQTVWDFGDGNTSTQTNPQHTYNSSGAYNVTLYKESSNGCIDSAVHVVNIFPIPEAEFNYSRAMGDSCGTPQHLQFSNLSSGADGFYWDFNFNNVPGVDTSRLNNPSFTYTDPGVYEVLLVARNGYDCYDSIIKTIIVRPFPEAGFTADTVEACTPFNVTFTDTTRYDFDGPGGIEEWYWDFGDGHTASGSAVVSHRYETDGVFNVSLTVVTDGGCVDSVTYRRYVVAHHTPEVRFNTSMVDSRTYFFGNNSIVKDPNVQWMWSFGDGQVSYEESPEHSYEVDLFEKDYSFTVCVTATNTAGCDSTVCRSVDLKGYQLSVPNAFAPDQENAGDGSIFLPRGHALGEYHLSIYDEWGNTVYESSSLDENGIPDEPWDGTFNGRELPMGAYVWKVRAIFNDGTPWPGKMYKDKIRRNHGTVTLIR